MAIEIAKDNHLAELKKLKKYELELCVFETLKEFKDSVESCSFLFGEETAYYACMDEEGNCYIGDLVCGSDWYENNIPSWCTHIYWYGK